MVSSRSLLSSLVYSASGLAQTRSSIADMGSTSIGSKPVPVRFTATLLILTNPNGRRCCRVFSVNEEQLRPFNPTN
ncbi:hypothetical protein L3X38_043986 [Prunus dulcis]|uniref:Uncharacterized protein n=1 Tax=Prunus dulcis TaxID=3755 RepID=A0AAD4UXS6_PRUDU|nr:hypothetical protein L3X38_043986 [Prunus dulcis]